MPDAGQVHGDFQRLVGLVDVDGRGAFARQGVGAEGPAELQEDLPHVIGKLADFRG